MKEKKHGGRLFMGTCLLVYVILMVLLLYAKGVSTCAYRIELAKSQGYWETVRRYTNPVPLKTIRPFLSLVSSFSLYDKIMNQIVGNILIFIPTGIFLPFYHEKLRRPVIFCVTALLLILFVEISQVLSFLGSFDVDDILLNICGCLIGWLLFSVLYGIVRLFKK